MRHQSILIAAFVVCLSLLAISCANEPVLRPYIVDSQYSWEAWLSSQEIVVGVVKRVVPASEIFRFERQIGGAIPVRLWRVDFDVEKSLRGKLPVGLVQISTFLFESGVSNYVGVAPYVLVPNQRKILFIRSENGRLRLVSDVYSLDVPIQGGKPDRVQFADSESVGDRIVEVFLTLGTNADPELMALEIKARFGPMTQISAPKNAVKLLKVLVDNENQRLRRSACLALAQNFPSEMNCLETLIPDGDDAFKTASRRLLERTPSHLISEIEHNPLSIGEYQRVDYAREMIELLSDHPDKGVRIASCDVLRRFSRYGPYPNCPILATPLSEKH